MTYQEYTFREASGTEHVMPVYLSGEVAKIDQLDTLMLQLHAVSCSPRHEAVYTRGESFSPIQTGRLNGQFPPCPRARPGPESCERSERDSNADLVSTPAHFDLGRASGRGYLTSL